MTGAGGLVGRHLVDYASDEDEVWAVTRSAGSATRGCGVQEVQIDLESEWDKRSAGLPDRCDSVVYLAQSKAYRFLPERADSLFQVNLVGLARFLEYAKVAGARSFVYASTGSVYRNSGRTISEDSELMDDGAGRNLYPWSKLTGEALVRSYSEHFSTAILRCFFVYGSGGDPGMLIPRLVERICAGESVGLHGEEGLVFPPLYAGDAARAFRSAVDLEGVNLINIAGPDSVSLRDFSMKAGEVLGREPIFHRMDGVPTDFRVDITKMEERLRVYPIPVQCGLREWFPEGSSN